jgi:hypothetical protein
MDSATEPTTTIGLLAGAITGLTTVGVAVIGLLRQRDKRATDLRQAEMAEEREQRLAAEAREKDLKERFDQARADSLHYQNLMMAHEGEMRVKQARIEGLSDQIRFFVPRLVELEIEVNQMLAEKGLPPKYRPDLVQRQLPGGAVNEIVTAQK